MFQNYFKIAWRNLKTNKASSTISIGGLAVGMTVAILIGLWLWDELSYNKSFTNYGRIVQVMEHQTTNGIVHSNTSIPFPLGNELRTAYGNDFKYVVMSSWPGDHILSSGKKIISQPGIYMDIDAPRMLSLKMLKGSQDGLKEPNSILLSASAAKAMFAEADPMDKLMKIDNKVSVKVTGVYADIPPNTDFGTRRFIAPWNLYITSEPWILKNKDEWNDNSYQLFAQLAEGKNLEAVNKSIVRSIFNHVPAVNKKADNPLVFLHPMADWHLRSNWDENGINTGGLIQYVWLFGMVGLFVLLLACINFMNLSTARSEKRAKEVGIRKAAGSLRQQLVSQFYCESLLIVLFAFVASLPTVWLLLPWFNEVAAKQIAFPWLNPLFWTSAIVFILFTGLVAGSYPALYLSSFQPVKVLKGTFKTGRFAALPRKALVVVQFTVSLALIISTMIIYRQIQYSKNRPIGYNRNGLMMIQMKSPDFYGKIDLLARDLKNSGAIMNMAESSSPMTQVWSNSDGFEWEGKDPTLKGEFATNWVTHDYGKTVGWKIAEGRDFSRKFATDSTGVVLNKAAVKMMNLRNPLGAIIRNVHDTKKRTYKVIGVTEDLVMDSPYKPVKQAMYFLDAENVNWMELKLSPTSSAAESRAKIESAFKKYIPSAPFDYQFADTEFAAKFATESRIGTLATFFASLAIFISCLGLFGLASFVAEQRTKEIGVRKVLGASVLNLWNLLSKEFILLVALSFLIAVPLSYYFMHGWLQDYEYRTQISWWVFVVAGLGALIITLITVSFQAIKAATASPVKSLRTE